MNVQFKVRHLATFVSLSAALFATASAQAATITAWDFNSLPIAVNNNPAPSIGTGTAKALGMTNSYTYADGTTGSINTDDILLNAAASPSSTGGADNIWRVRGASPNNGWNLAAPQYSQGVEFDTSTVGFKNVAFKFDWFSTAQGVRDLQVQFNTNTASSAVWTNAGGLLTAIPNSFLNGIIVDFSAVAGTSNNANFGIRLVSAYDPALPAGTYGAATLSATNTVLPYNNMSGNWRFDNVSFSGTASATTAVPEPFTIIGTLVGGAAALRMKKRLKVEYKDID